MEPDRPAARYGRLVLRLVIFDCDGVLVDTETIANRVLAELVTLAGLPTTTAQSVTRYMGRSMASVCALVEDELGRQLPPDFVASYYDGIYAEFDTVLEAVPGAASALDAIEAAGLMTCVASSGPHDKMRRTLGATGLFERFEGRIFSAADVARGKPFPDLFLHAAASMGVDPSHCAVVEDSPAGVEAAIAAGMVAVGFPGLLGTAPLAAAGATPIESMGALAALIDTLRHTGAPAAPTAIP